MVGAQYSHGRVQGLWRAFMMSAHSCFLIGSAASQWSQWYRSNQTRTGRFCCPEGRVLRNSGRSGREHRGQRSAENGSLFMRGMVHTPAVYCRVLP